MAFGSPWCTLFYLPDQRDKIHVSSFNNIKREGSDLPYLDHLVIPGPVLFPEESNSLIG